MDKYLLICILLTASSLFGPDKALDSKQDPGASTVPPAIKVLSQKTERYYTLTASIKPIIGWISRDGVGGGRISLMEKQGEKQIQLLIGSDPDRAPWHINRWGYISENVANASTELIGIMTRSDEDSIAKASDAVHADSETYPFKAIRSRSDEKKIQSSTYLLNLSENFTYKDVDTVIDLVPKTDLSIRRMEITPGVDPGFLHSVKEMIHETIAEYQQSGHVKSKFLKPRQYIYNATLFQLSLKSSKILEKVNINGCSYSNLIESRFETRNKETGKTTKFTVIYGTEGPLNGIPVKIVYQPRWWFKAELLMMTDKDKQPKYGGFQQKSKPSSTASDSSALQIAVKETF